MITRILESLITERLFSGKSILLLGPRQVGKTTLIRQLFENNRDKAVWINADNIEDRELLNNLNSTRAIELFPPGRIVFIDEAQRIENSGLTLKIIHDSCSGIQLIATGSSSFELTDKIKESLTGRKWSFRLLPVSFREILDHTNFMELNRSLETRMIYGSYPEIITQAGKEREILSELVSDYLYRDLFSLREVRKPDILEKIAKALSFQVGNQVSNRELAKLVQVDKETVDKYIYLLEQAFIIFSLPSFSRNLRSELKRSRKIYFYDNGIRNALINQFNPLPLRQDAGALWENLMISERIKRNEYERKYCNSYFWRTHGQQEIDYIEEYDGQLQAYEFKWQPGRSGKSGATFLESYPGSDYQEINRENFYDFVLKD